MAMAAENRGITTSVIGLVDYTAKHVEELARRCRNLVDSPDKIKDASRDCEYVRKELHRIDEGLREKQIKVNEDLQADFLAQIVNIEEVFKKARTHVEKLDRLFPNEEPSSISDRLVRRMAKVRRLCCFRASDSRIEALARAISDAKPVLAKLSSFVHLCDQIEYVQEEADHAKEFAAVLSSKQDDVEKVDIDATSPDTKAENISVDVAATQDDFRVDRAKIPGTNIEHVAFDAAVFRDDFQAGEVTEPQSRVEHVSPDSTAIHEDLGLAGVRKVNSKIGYTAVDAAPVKDDLQAGTGGVSDSFKRKFKRKLKKESKAGKDLERSRSVATQAIDADPKFIAKVRACLQTADKWAEKRKLRRQDGEILSCSQLFLTMAVLRPQIRVSRSMLGKLWRLPDDDLVSEIVDKLAELNLISVAKGTETEEGVGLRDVVLQYCQLQAGDRLRKYHCDLLDEYFRSDTDSMTLEELTDPGYLHLLPRSGKISLRTWWTATSDGYIHENVCRHLAASGCISELVALLSHGSWTEFRITCGDLLAWENDFHWAFDALGKRNDTGASEHNKKNILEGLRLIRDALQDGWLFTTQNPRETAFQTHARLCDVPSKIWIVRSYLESARANSEKPWLKPTRRYWPLPGRAPSTEVFREGSVSSISLTNGMVLAAVAVGPEVLICNMETRTVLQRLRGHKSEVDAVAFSLDGEHIASVSRDGTMLLWNRESTATFSEPRHLLSEGLFTSVAMTKDASLILAGARDGCVKLLDWANGKTIRELREYRSPVTAVAISEDGKHIAFSSKDGALRIWDAMSGNQRCMLLRDNGPFISCLAISADGSRVASGSYDNTIQLWDGKNGTLLREPLRGHAAWVRCVAMTPDGTRVVSGADDNTLRVWDGRSGEDIAMLCKHEGSVSAVAISADGLNIVTGSRDKSIRFWVLENETRVSEWRQWHRDSVMCVAMSADGTRIASGSKDKTVRLWNGENGAPICGPLLGHESRVVCVALSANGTRVASGSEDSTIRIWDWEGQRQIGKPLRGHEDSVICVAISDDATRVVSGSRDGTLRLWDLGKTVVANVQLHGHKDWVNCVAMSPDASTVVSGSRDRTIRLWKVSSREMIGSLVTFNACSIWMRDGFVFARHRYFGEGKIGTKCWVIDEKEGLVRCAKNEEVDGVSWRIPHSGQSAIGGRATHGDAVLSSLPASLGASLAEQYSFISCSKQRVIGGQPISDDGYVLATLPAGLGISMVEQDAWFFQPRRKGTGVLAVGLRDGMVCILELIR